jgi:uncharacterized damage-inducible protein DinB
MQHRTLIKLAKSREKLLAAADLPDDALDFQPATGWTVRQTLTHLLNSEEDHCRIIVVFARDELHRLPTEFDLNEHNERRVAERGHLTRDELLDALHAQRQRTEDLFNRLDDDQRAKTGPHPALGELSIDAIFRVLAVHEQQHTREIEAVRAEWIESTTHADS